MEDLTKTPAGASDYASSVGELGSRPNTIRVQMRNSNTFKEFRQDPDYEPLQPWPAGASNYASGVGEIGGPPDTWHVRMWKSISTEFRQFNGALKPCWTCGELGHSKFRCPVNVHLGRLYCEVPNFCDICNQVGHSSRSCPWLDEYPIHGYDLDDENPPIGPGYILACYKCHKTGKTLPDSCRPRVIRDPDYKRNEEVPAPVTGPEVGPIYPWMGPEDPRKRRLWSQFGHVFLDGRLWHDDPKDLVDAREFIMKSDDVVKAEDYFPDMEHLRFRGNYRGLGLKSTIIRDPVLLEDWRHMFFMSKFLSSKYKSGYESKEEAVITETTTTADKEDVREYKRRKEHREEVARLKATLYCELCEESFFSLKKREWHSLRHKFLGSHLVMRNENVCGRPKIRDKEFPKLKVGGLKKFDEDWGESQIHLLHQKLAAWLGQLGKLQVSRKKDDEPKISSECKVCGKDVQTLEEVESHLRASHPWYHELQVWLRQDQDVGNVN